MSTLAEIEEAVASLSPDERELLERRLHAMNAGRTGAELAGLWAALPHLSDDEAAAFERDIVAARAAMRAQAAPAWE